MPRPREFTIEKFSGIDRRSLSASSDPSSLFEANNVDLLPGGDLRRRDGLRKVVDLLPDSIGLYVSGGGLRAAVPSGYNLATYSPINFTYDTIGNTASVPTAKTTYVRVHGTTSWGADAVIGAYPYLVLETVGGQYEHHWVNQTPTTTSPYVNTRVVTPFRSGPSLIKMQGKIFSPDQVSGNVHFSSTEFGPGTWDAAAAPLDAGFISPDQYTTGDVTIRGVTEHNEHLVVVMDNSVQFWQVAPDPRLHAHLKTYTGPGTGVFGSLAKVIGDIFYFSDGGFRSLVTETTIGEQRESDLGEAIAELSSAFAESTADEVRAIWSAARSQYICMFSGDGKTDVFCFTLSPTSKTTGWTRWELPVAVDYLVELDRELYIRAGDELFVFDPLVEKDGTTHPGTVVTGTIQTNFDNAGRRRAMKKWNYLDIVQEGTCNINYLYNDNDRSHKARGAVNITGNTAAYALIPVGLQTHSLALEFTCTAPWRLGSVTKEFEILNGAG